jgi:hypothetical protein
VAAYYDQKGRLYRVQNYEGYFFDPNMGQGLMYGAIVTQYDFVDLHSTFQVMFNLPAAFRRTNFTMQYLVKMGK